MSWGGDKIYRFNDPQIFLSARVPGYKGTTCTQKVPHDSQEMLCPPSSQYLKYCKAYSCQLIIVDRKMHCQHVWDMNEELEAEPRYIHYYLKLLFSWAFSLLSGLSQSTRGSLVVSHLDVEPESFNKLTVWCAFRSCLGARQWLIWCVVKGGLWECTESKI